MAIPLLALPVILKGAAVAAGTVGAAAGATGVHKSYKATMTMKDIKAQHEKNLEMFDHCTKKTQLAMDSLGILELEVLSDFQAFSAILEQIQNAPEFKPYEKDDVIIPVYDPVELKKVYVGAGTLLSGIGGAALGTAGGFAAAGATTSAVTALGVASTGTALSTLSGAALTNATLAILGGGPLAVGGGGMAAGTIVLSATTMGAGILVGGVLFAMASGALSQKAAEAELQMLAAEAEIDDVCNYLAKLSQASKDYLTTLTRVQACYKRNMTILDYIINQSKKTNWSDFNTSEKLVLENTCLLVALLYKMCQVPLVLAPKSEEEQGEINTEVLQQVSDDATQLLENMTL